MRSFGGGLLLSEETSEVSLFDFNEILPRLLNQFQAGIANGTVEVLELDCPDVPRSLYWFGVDPSGLLVPLRPTPSTREGRIASRFLAIKPEPLCHCGRLLHYTDMAIRAGVEQFIHDLGPDTTVTIGERSWLVPRHYIALHGLKASEIAGLGFPEVTTT